MQCDEVQNPPGDGRMHTAHAPRAPAAITATNVTDALDHVERVPDASARDRGWTREPRRGTGCGAIRDKQETYSVQEVRDVLQDCSELLGRHAGKYIAREAWLCCARGRGLGARCWLVGGGSRRHVLEGGVVGGLCRCHLLRDGNRVSDRKFSESSLR